MNTVDRLRGCDDITVLRWILDDKRHNRCTNQTIQLIYWVFGKILAETDNKILELILSDDCEIRSIGMQMLFPHWIDWYTEMFNDVTWRSILNGVIISLAEITKNINDRSYL